MTFSDVKKILNSKIIVPFDKVNGIVPLKEDDPQSKLEKVEIYGLHKDTIVFKLDHKKIKKKSGYLSNKAKLHSGCDYVLLTRYEEQNFILFFELKSDSIKGAAAQLRHSTPFIDYMASLLKIHHDDFEFPIDRRYIVFFRGKRLNKTRTYTGKKSTECYIKPYEGLNIKYFKNTERIYISKILENID